MMVSSGLSSMTSFRNLTSFTHAEYLISLMAGILLAPTTDGKEITPKAFLMNNFQMLKLKKVLNILFRSLNQEEHLLW
jgi:hypothetical protein